MKLHNDIIKIIYSYCHEYNNIIENINNEVKYTFHFINRYKIIDELNDNIDKYNILYTITDYLEEIQRIVSYHTFQKEKKLS